MGGKREEATNRLPVGDAGETEPACGSSAAPGMSGPMRRWISTIGAMLYLFSCSSGNDGAGGTGAIWRCRINPTSGGQLCDCKLGGNSTDYPETSCPPSNYKCCESRTAAESYDGIQTCTCWNPEDIPDCQGAAPIVPLCPTSGSANTGGSTGSSVGWCCATSGTVCLCRDDQSLPCSYDLSCPATHTCCIAGPDQDGNHCSCYSDTYLAQVGMTCAERADPGETLVPSCPN